MRRVLLVEPLEDRWLPSVAFLGPPVYGPTQETEPNDSIGHSPASS